MASLAQQVEDMRAQRDQLQVQLEHKIAEAYQLDGTVNVGAWVDARSDGSAVCCPLRCSCS